MLQRRPCPHPLRVIPIFTLKTEVGMEKGIVSSHWDDRYETGVRSSWFSSKAVGSELNRRITGSDKFWLWWVFNEYLQEKPKRIISIGCGDGAHELIIARNHWAESVDAFDLSPIGIRQAAETAKEEGINANFFVRDFNDFIQNPGGDYDAAIFIGSLHHVTDLEGMLGAVRKSLVPNGHLIINEYCGPCYNIYDKKRVDLLNSVIRSISVPYKRHPDAKWVNHSIEHVFAVDPSESVRSSLILPFLEFYFDKEIHRPFGGALLHPIFDLLNAEKINDGSEDSDTVVKMLIEMENQLQANGVIPSDFMFGVYRNSKV
ncbi:methyltransferase domain-containing protein [Agrobacterium vitis]|uniref:Class I SAM-dependent methyltransferase n=2 Tax=Agrobacterium vitis TaxID=373 RepID=A0A6I4EKK4_AGRVI|nr:class I SAM-dependent methyltransferase [Agrobacterium vitis]MCF1480034.1 class I SAM-dependent methyltransferase [Agrobacterium vitis]MUZ98372.1 methyltransferase domain-containing protein [Agrobacterium vitis]MVA32790.1 methyltransferase domain-containing protein [Agrobacterium vitis]